MGRSLTPVEIGVRRPDKKFYLQFWSLSVYEAGSGEVFSLPVVHIANNLIVDLGLETEPSDDIVIRTSESRAAYLTETINDLTDLLIDNAGDNGQELEFIRLEFDGIIIPLVVESGELFTLHAD